MKFKIICQNCQYVHHAYDRIPKCRRLAPPFKVTRPKEKCGYFSPKKECGYCEYYHHEEGECGKSELTDAKTFSDFWCGEFTFGTRTGIALCLNKQLIDTK